MDELNIDNVGERFRQAARTAYRLPAVRVQGYAMGGVIFACGLPGWAIVRWLFNFIDERRDASIDEVAKDVKELL